VSTTTHDIGELSFISGLPISWPFAHGRLPEHAGRRLVGRPGELDAMMARGELAAAPISTLEYIRRRDRYNLVPNVSISAWGRLGSAVLFARGSFAKLGGTTIALPPQGGTSNALIQWLLHRMFGVQAQYVEAEGTLAEVLEQYPAALVIGDLAVQEARRDLGHTQLDLGEAWWHIMKTPCVTTVWAVQRSLPPEDQKALAALFTKAKEIGQAHLADVVAEAAARLDMPGPEVEAYYALLNYDLTPVHEQGIRLLAEDLAEVSIH
jgi:chorismate dehydratase